MAIVEVSNLSKSYGDNQAVSGVSFSVEDNEVFGLLGPNGAGKTTTISMLCGLTQPTGGDVLVDGLSVRKSPDAVKKILGVIPQDIALYPTLSARENLTFWGRMYGLGGHRLKARVDDVLEIVGLADRAKEKIETYSGGMKRRINIGAGLLHRPKVLLMDEPTVGIDPQSRNHILETVKRLNAEGMAIIYTSHYMEEVEFLCDRVGIMDHGKIIAMGTQEELAATVGNAERIEVETSGEASEFLDEVRALDGVDGVEGRDGSFTVLAPDSGVLLPSLMAFLGGKGVPIHHVQIEKPNLESVFLHLTGKSLRD